MRLLLIDDHPLFVDGFATMIAKGASRLEFCSGAQLTRRLQAG